MIARVANTLWSLASVPAYVAFRAALHEPERTQAAILRRYVERNADTAFGRRHGFDRIASPADFARRVPVADYDATSPDIDRVARGESNVLTADAVVRLATSSGSTRARKLIPYTRELQREFGRAIGPWIVDLFARDPSLIGGPAYWSISPVVDAPPEPARPAGAPPIGFDDDSAALGGIAARLVDAVMAVPASVRLVRDVDAFRYATALALLRRRDLRLVSVWHPSFLELLLDTIVREWPQLLDDVGDRPLRDVDPRDVRAIWPRLGLVSCWADAHAGPAAASLVRRLGGVTLQPKGLLATEAFVTIPFAGRWPLAVRSHYVELLDDRGRVRGVESLRLGDEADVVVTTAGGLYRYRLGDRVIVDGFVGRTPSLRFVGRSDHVVDRRGEKLSEGFVGRVLRDLIPDVAFSVLAPESIGHAVRYALFATLDADASTDTLAVALDARLSENPHYRYARQLGQLAPAVVVRAADDVGDRFLRAEVAAGRRLGDVKASPLSAREHLRDLLIVTCSRRT